MIEMIAFISTAAGLGLIIINRSLTRQLKINDLILIECEKRIEFLKASKAETSHEVDTKALNLHSVNQRSELFALLKWMQNEPVFNIDDIDEILDDYDFYKANCG